MKLYDVYIEPNIQFVMAASFLHMEILQNAGLVQLFKSEIQPLSMYQNQTFTSTRSDRHI